ncbi:N-acetylmuramoyl-L-alanine amidase [Actinoplanes sp. G11-F43]|uniref:N-acetylmuramoyl-L-alanine amidase n=1 Tax=Actinoplanes sp. G11-F43 TaxID=3424130 RepID=UPI003D34904B
MKRKVAIGIGTATAVLAAGGGVAILTWPSGPSGATAPAPVAAPVATPATVTGTLPPDPSPAPPRVRSALRTVGLQVSGAKAGLPERATERFSMLGVTWDDGASAPDGTIEVRTRSVATGKWSGWESLEARDDAPDGAEAADLGRGATAPLWVGPSDGVAARIAGRGAGLPKGLRLDLIDPGSEPAGRRTGSEPAGRKTGGGTGGQGGGEPVPSAPAPDVTPSLVTPSTETPVDDPAPEPTEPVAEEPEPGEPSAAPAPEPAVSDPAAPAPAGSVAAPPAESGKASISASTTAPIAARFPSYVTRAGWSADETIVKRDEIVIADTVQVVWLHHTAHAKTGANDYSCAAASTIIRAIQTYDIESDGFSDIGYNYLVDKCGRLYEGRAGGVDKAVVPAAVKGFNTGYASIAVIGDYMTAASTAAVEAVVAQVAAARLGRYGFDPASQVTLKAVIDNDRFKTGDTFTVPRLAGHRDADATLCPGTGLVNRLPAIRSAAQLTATGLALTSVTGGGLTAGAYHVKKSAALNWTVSAESTPIAGFDVLVDGAVATTVAADERTATVAVPAGKHTVTLRARHTSGGTAQLGVVIHGDPTAPTFKSAMTLVLGTGTYNAGAVPVRLTPNGADNLKLAGYRVSKPKAATLGPVTSWATTVKPGAATWTVTASDVAGNTRTATLNRTVTIAAETAAKKSGTWTRKTSTGHLGGKALTASTRNAKLTWTFTGRNASLLFSRTAKSGKVAIYVDGRKVTTLDLKSAKTLNRQAVWTRNLTYGKHTVAIVVQGTSKRPAVVSDGLAYLR